MTESMRSLTARVFASAKQMDEDARTAYRGADLKAGYWSMVDLKASASFRLEAGDLESFVRLRVFSDTLAKLVQPYQDMVIFKELGDGVLVRSESFRSLIEVLAVLDGVTQYWKADSQIDRLYPSLASRSAVTFGDCFYASGDYFGSPIDRVARLSGIRPSGDDVLAVVADDVRARNEVRIRSELPFIAFDEPLPVPEGVLKPGETSFLISTMRIDRAAFARFTDYFEPLRRSIGSIDV